MYVYNEVHIMCLQHVVYVYSVSPVQLTRIRILFTLKNEKKLNKHR